MISRTMMFVAAFALAACEQPAAPLSRFKSSQVQPTGKDDIIKENQSVDISGTVVSPCTGEAIAFSGSSHIISTIDVADNGATLNYHFNTQALSGIGLVSGTKYQISDVISQTENVVFVPSSGSADVAVHYRIISAGNLDNFLGDFVYTFTFPPLNATYKIQNLRCEG